MDLDQLAAYLHRDVREVAKMVSRGHVPGRKVGGEWRFAKAEINQWMETQVPNYSDLQLTTLEKTGDRSLDQGPLIATLIREATIAVPLAASTKASVLKELVQLAEQTWQVYGPETVLEAVRAREELASTALPGGVAIPHPRRPLPAALGESVMAYARVQSAIPFGAPMGGLTDIFFLVCSRADRTPLRVLTPLTRLPLPPTSLYQLLTLPLP